LTLSSTGYGGQGSPITHDLTIEDDDLDLQVQIEATAFRSEKS
jgi:hypothetical protein